MALSKITNLSITDDAVRTVGIQDDNVTLAKLGDGTQGDILYYGASGAPTRLGFGTSGDFLKTQGTGANPAWATVTDNGKVLQVLSASVGNVSTTSTSFADVGLTVDITPAATSSKILVLVNMVGQLKGIANNSIEIVLVRDTTDILDIEAIAGYTNNTIQVGVGGVGCSFLDSPSTTSATTYKVQWALSTGSTAYQIGAWYAGSTRPLSTITVMEIGA